MKAYFISDIHIVEASDQRGLLFLKFLKSISVFNCTHLFLVGDIFDLWISDHTYFVDRFKLILDELQRLQSENVQIHYFEGNHDLYLDRYFSKIGIHVHTQAEYFDLGLKIRVEHGDQMDPSDRGYHFLRWLLRTKVVVWMAHHLPGALVAWLGQTLSQQSRTYTSTIKSVPSEHNLRALKQHAQMSYDKKPFDLMISGHVHEQADFRIGGARVINLGTWLKNPVAFFVEESSQKFIEIVE